MRIPPIKIVEQGRENQTALAIIVANSRVPRNVLGDLRSQRASLRVGEQMLDETEARVRDRVAAMPDGEYAFEDFMDNCGTGTEPQRIAVKVTIAGDRILVDFEGTDPQSESGLNSYFNYTRSCDYAAVKCLTDPYGPTNAGAHRFPGLLSQPPAPGRWRSPYNAANIPVEAVEAATPVIVERFEFIPDSCGRGKYRGGLGVRRDVRILGESIKFTNLSERHRFPPFGVMGGTPARVGRTVINPDTAGDYEIGGKASVDLSYGDVVSFRLAGAGGYGDPSERDPKLIEEDLRLGLVTEW